eukprot:g8190.t1
MPALSSPGEMLQTGVVACRDDKNQIGIFGCDKRSKPNCCLRCLAGSFIVTNHEGLSVLAVIDHRPRGGGTDCNLFATTSASYECATAAWPYHTSKTLDFGTEDDEFEDDEYDYSSDDELIP